MINLGGIRSLAGGWHDGQGKEFPADGLDWLELAFCRHWPEDLDLPHAFPTVDGLVFCEWFDRPMADSVEIDLVARTGEWHCCNLDTNEDVIEKTLNLQIENDWQWLIETTRANRKINGC